MEERYNKIHAAERSTFNLPEHEQIQSIKSTYEINFRDYLRSCTLRNTPDPDLEYVLKSAYIAAIYTHRKEYLEDIYSILSEMERRNVATDEERGIFYRVLIVYREFATARRYLAERPNLDVESVPEIVLGEYAPSQKNDPLIYQVSTDQFRMVAERETISEGNVMIVVAHPLCAFSRRAMKEIGKDQQLSSALPARTIWLTPVDENLHFQEIQTWNLEHPTTPVSIAHDQSEWPMIEAWATPNFYLLRDGKLIGRFSGWPQGGNRDKLIALLEQGGLWPASHDVAR